MYGVGEKPEVAKISEGNYLETESYLWGLDLFNHGFFWEAHEAWEGLWKNLSRESREGVFLQALIQLAASYLKMRDGNLEGAEKLFKASQDKFKTALKGKAIFMGLDAKFLLEALALEKLSKGEFPILSLQGWNGSKSSFEVPSEIDGFCEEN